MHALIDIEHADPSRFDEIANTLRKAVANPRAFKSIRAKPSSTADVRLVFRHFNSRSVEKALRNLSFSLGVPSKSAKGEGFVFNAQEDLTDRHSGELSKLVQGVYDFVIDYFGLPKVSVVRKAAMTWRGKVVYSPATGEPVSEAEWQKFTADLERFLNRASSLTGKRIVLDAATLAKLLDRMVQSDGLEKARKARLEDLTAGGRSFDWISESTRHIANIMGGMTRSELGRLEVLSTSAGERLTHASEGMKSAVRQVLVDGIVAKKTKGQVSQDLFDKLVGANRDFQRIADTETQRAFNESFVREEASKVSDGEAVYFRRIEVIDGNTCAYCKKINGTVARWSDVPLDGGAIKDEWASCALWEGKEAESKPTRIADAPSGVCHPYCRGVWVRCNPSKEAKLHDEK